MIQPARSVVCQKLFDVEESSPRWSIADVGVGPAHDPIVMLCLGDWQRSVSWKTAQLRPGRTSLSEMPDDGEGFRTLRPYIGDTWLYLRRSGRHPSVHSVDENGYAVQTFPIDDSVAEIAATAEGDIWTSYSDEGVYSGNHLSSAGLCCMDADGFTLYHHNDHVVATISLDDPRLETLLISDCYAMNLVSSVEVWAHWYTQFPLARIVDYRIDRIWEGFPFRGASAFAVGDGHALFTGGYHETNLNLVDLSTMQVIQLEPVDSRGRPVNYGRWLSAGQADTLYLASEQTVYAVTVSQALAASNS